MNLPLSLLCTCTIPRGVLIHYAMFSFKIDLTPFILDGVDATDERKSKRDDGCNLKFELADTNDDFFSTTTSTPFTLTLLHTTVHSIKTIIDQEKKLIKTLSLFLPTSHFSLHS